MLNYCHYWICQWGCHCAKQGFRIQVCLVNNYGSVFGSLNSLPSSTCLTKNKEATANLTLHGAQWPIQDHFPPKKEAHLAFPLLSSHEHSKDASTSGPPFYLRAETGQQNAEGFIISYGWLHFFGPICWLLCHNPAGWLTHTGNLLRNMARDIWRDCE